MRLRPACFLAICLIAVAGCATGRVRSRIDRDVITRQQMLENKFVTVYDAVTALHSNWLNVRPNTLTSTQEDVVIYYDATRLGGPQELSNIRVTDVQYVEHLDAVAATQRYGVGHSQGVILVSSHAR